MKSTLAHGDPPPIVFLIFNRPDCTRRVWEQIRAAGPERLFVVADGPRATHPTDYELCREAREIVSSPDWPCELQTNFVEENLGCRRRISSGLSWVFEQCAEAIILEDDCLPCASFFEFCAQLLERFRDDTRVMSIGGANFQLGHSRGNASYYFSGYTHIWGWATWRRAWRLMDVQLVSWPKIQQEDWLMSVLEDPQERQYWTDIFERCYRGEIDSWGYPWLHSCWSQGGLCAVANQNLVTNIGGGPQATHTTGDVKVLEIPTQELTAMIHPATVFRNRAADRFHWEQHILSEVVREEKSRRWLSRTRKKLALRSRVRSLIGRLPLGVQGRISR